MEKNTAIVMYTVINGKRQYVSSGTTRSDNRIIPSINSDITKARQFEDSVAANRFKSRIYNPYDRIYEFETVAASSNSAVTDDDVFTTFPD